MSFCPSENQSLKAMNTLAVQACADLFYQFDSVSQLVKDWPQIKQHANRLVLGGGSNILFAGDFHGLVIHPQIFGIELIEETDEYVRVSVGASENWHQFVVNMTKRGYFGLENLALIPGTVGASPVQNIGAYGVEVKSLIHRVECFNLESGELTYYNNQACEFDYRDSRFKKAGQGKYLVTRVEFDLQKTPDIEIDYQPLRQSFSDQSQVSPQQVLDKVCEIRRSKLPDPELLPNAGSFFKNPLVSQNDYLRIKKAYPDLIAYPSGNQMKLAAGWLIDNAGLKGHREGSVGIHTEQALVIVNYGEPDGKKIWRLATAVQKLIYEKYAVSLEPEVRIEGLNG